MSDPRYLFDTNVVSEGRRKRPNAQVVAFVDSIREEQAFLSVLTLGELRKGVAIRNRSDPRGAESLSLWIDQVEADFGDRILPVDLAIADVWGRLAAGRPRPVVDTLIAATAIVRDLTLVTRNTRDVADTGVTTVNPWTHAG